MADADYFLDLSSSPDPLADDVPSSVRPASRRIIKSQHELLSHSAPRSSPLRAKRATSPRKRTFQLDVGDEQSPQRIRVTVEAEDSLRHDAVNRKLFPRSSSPTKSPRPPRLGATTTTTTTVPLNDDDGPIDGTLSTPQKRGRKRRTSNGTPMPRGRKRAGTPIRRKSKQPRLEDEPPSDASGLNGAGTDVGDDGNEETPRPRARIRKTPTKPSANRPVPSSQVSSKTTGRKRGRPRKVPNPEDPTIVTGTRPETSGVTRSSPPAFEPDGRDDGDHADGHSANPSLDPPPAPSVGPTSIVGLTSPLDPATRDKTSGSPTSSNQEFAENDDFIMDEDYQGMEPQSDLPSAGSEDGITRHQQDTIADASEFSMIALESLPSFQASFQASLHDSTNQPASNQFEMGEETSKIVNETLDSLRRSLQNQTKSSSRSAKAEDHSRTEHGDEAHDQSNFTASHHSGRAFSKSPRRPKQIPLSRQVFVGRGDVDDSFSTIPDSILHAATPGRLPMKPTVGEHEHRYQEDGPYDDSFSEIPEAILEAATPRPPKHVESSTRRPSARNEKLQQTAHSTAHSTARRPSVDFGSNRLPTPEDTSSSNAGSRKELEEDPGRGPEYQTDPVHGADVPSSPPIRNRPHALEIGYSNLHHELSSVQERRSSSPTRQPGKVLPGQLQSLEPPPPVARPSLSPIVRAGRTLQNVMSDNSSPEVREGNLGSPFRGSMSSDHPGQSSVARSPSPSIRKGRISDKSQLSSGSATRSVQNARSNLDKTSGEAGQSLGRDNMTQSMKEAPLSSARQQPSDPASFAHHSHVVGSTKTDSLNTKGNSSGVAPGNSPHGISRQQHHRAGSRGQTTSKIRSADPSWVATTDDEAYSYREQDQALRGESAEDMDDDLGQGFEREHVDDDDDDDDVDIWDIEASRTSPGKPEPVQTSSREFKPDVPLSRRTKVPSPWRRNNRRLIYKDNIASSSQIDIEESSQSEVEQYQPILSQEQTRVSRPQHDEEKAVQDHEPANMKQMQQELYGLDNAASPNTSHYSFEEDAGSAYPDDPDSPVEDQELNAVEQLRGTPDLMREDYEENTMQEEPEDMNMSAAPEPSIHVSEYSLVAQQANQKPKAQEKKSRFFGGFDLLSFFSSPAALPGKNTPGTNPPKPINQPSIRQPVLTTKRAGDGPGVLWSTGLFPSLPQETSEPNSGRRPNLSSPASVLRSTDTVADTYEPSTSISPSPVRSSPVSVAPSTPEPQNFPPIPQKQNFTPRPGGSRGSLFAPSQPSAPAARSESYDYRESSDEQESSGLTEASEYERVPPREKPSQWDRNLSPSKSCLRSPLKPATPGRTVVFSNNALSPLAQVQARNTLRDGTNVRNTILQGPPLRPAFEGKENQPHPHTRKLRDANNNSLDQTAPKPPSAATREAQKSSSAAVVSTEAVAALSQTTWSKQHWIRLDEMLQLRRHDPLRFEEACALPPRDGRRSSALLGMEASTRGSRLVLEPWHLDVVEAFRLEVGGWDERALAKRVFALVIGEEMRRDAATTAAADASAAAAVITAR
ncbi:hypothetical protein F4802DRAFT_492273 [Xylaria palmicola]|nr:hypothetical protein F4802DRAFT_492273 [Xylaria palmicola]